MEDDAGWHGKAPSKEEVLKAYGCLRDENSNKKCEDKKLWH